LNDYPLPKYYFNRIMRAIKEFEMVAPGDRVLVGFSGGKDSAFLLYALRSIQAYADIPFSLAALTIDPMFPDAAFPEEHLRSLCERLEVPFFFERTTIAEFAFAQDARENPCPRCSYLRRGAINRFATENGFNRVALAHHHDDAVETFLLSLFYNGQIKTFLPVTEQDRAGVSLIRPLIYLREFEVKAAYHKFFDFYQPVPSPCPLDKTSKRAEVKQTLIALSKTNRQLYANLGQAIRTDAFVELWPAAKKTR
jgi:tRNA(Ile)-lysidine synthase TilS/MesJ